VTPRETDRRREIETAILHTVLYADLFDYPLTHNEIAHYLIGVEADAQSIDDCLRAPIGLDGRLQECGGFVVTRGREALIDCRRARQMSSARLWIRARRFARIVAALPFVRMIAVTGALAMDNSADGDDIDVMIVTARGRAWTARLFTVALVRLGKLFGDTLCPNYVITEDALALDERTLFTAHEYAQMVPVYGFSLYQRMCCANEWVYTHLPNARTPLKREKETRTGPVGRLIKRMGEWLLRGELGDALERWEMRRKLRKFALRITPASSVILDRNHVKGHFDDYSAPVLTLYAQRLAEFNRVDSEQHAFAISG